jgi:hypothetical protein
MKATVILVALAAVAGCNKADKPAAGPTASAKCEVVNAAVICDVTQSLPDGEHEVCWDFSVTCPNGASLSIPHECRTVTGHDVTELTITPDRVTKKGVCEGDKKARVTNLTLDGKPLK